MTYMKSKKQVSWMQNGQIFFTKLFHKKLPYKMTQLRELS